MNFVCYIKFLLFPKRIGETTHGDVLSPTMDLKHSRACDGQFEEEYQTVKAVGKGAFGFVWKAIRRSDGQEVRTSTNHYQIMFNYVLPIIPPLFNCKGCC